MDRSEAAVVLGVAHDAGPREVRAAYRRRIRQQHPDVAGEGSTTAAARIIEAYALLRTPAPPPSPRRPAAAAAPTRPAPSAWVEHDDDDDDDDDLGAADSVVMIDGETMGFSFPADEVFQLLVDTAYEVGDVTYVDPEANLLEVRVQFCAGGPPCSVVLSLQGRADRVEAFCTVESLDGTRPPPTEEVVSLLSRILATRLRSRRSSSG